MLEVFQSFPYLFEEFHIRQHEQMGVENLRVLITHLTGRPVAEFGNLRFRNLYGFQEAFPFSLDITVPNTVAGNRRALVVGIDERLTERDARCGQNPP